ncbi:response regulator, partial [bacterium]|nr:response regulator [bacterium]
MISGMYKTRLEQEGYIVVTADNGSQGLEVAVREKPDLILLDIMMPQMDGFALLQELRLHDSFKKTPIIMLTNLGTTEDREKGEQFGATDYLVKANLTPTEVSIVVAKYAEGN